MPSNEDIQKVYDFESVLERGLQDFFADNQIKSFTSQDFGATNADGTPKIDFQKERPRVEIYFVTGPGQGQWRPLTIDDVEVPMETSFKGRFTLDIITGVDMRAHAAYRSMVRFLVHGKLLTANGTDPLTLHKIQPFYKDAGSSPTYKAEEGYLRSQLTFDIDFSIQDDAWELLQDDTTPVEPAAGGPLITEDDLNILTEDGNQLVTENP